MKNVTDFRKMVENGVVVRACSSPSFHNLPIMFL